MRPGSLEWGHGRSPPATCLFCRRSLNKSPPPHSLPLWLIKTDWHALMKSPDFTNMKRERKWRRKEKKPDVMLEFKEGSP